MCPQLGGISVRWTFRRNWIIEWPTNSAHNPKHSVVTKQPNLYSPKLHCPNQIWGFWLWANKFRTFDVIAPNRQSISPIGTRSLFLAAIVSQRVCALARLWRNSWWSAKGGHSFRCPVVPALRFATKSSSDFAEILYYCRCRIVKKHDKSKHVRVSVWRHVVCFCVLVLGFNSSCKKCGVAIVAEI